MMAWVMEGWGVNVGLNYLKLDHEDAIDILEVDNTAVRPIFV